MVQNYELSPEKYYEEAKVMLNKKDLLGFVSNISIAVELSMNDLKMKAKFTYLKSKGLVKFSQYTKAIESIDEALKYNTGKEVFHLKKLKATAKGFLGRVNEAINMYEQLLGEAKDNISIVRISVNLAWAYLILDRENPTKMSLKEAKKYLDMAIQYFEDMPNSLKINILNNYSVYYFYQSKYGESIQMLEKAIEYAEEKDLSRIYCNLAEVYINYREDSGYENTSFFEYLRKSESLAFKYDNKLEIACSLFVRGKLELMDEQIFKALDTLYLALDYFKEAEAYSYSLECVQKINEIIKRIGKCVTNINNFKFHNNNQKDISITKSLKTYNFSRHKKLLEFVSQRVNLKNNIEMINLKIYEGVVKGYYGNLDEAVKTFKDVIDQTKDQEIITTSCLNIARLYMGLDGQTFDEHKLADARKYLDLVNDQFDLLSHEMKYYFLLNYGFYFYLKNDYKKSIEILENSIEYCEEKYLADLYNNIAELYINSANDNSFSEITHDYLEKAEGLGTKFNEILSLGQTFYLRAEVELREDQFFTALDTLYLSFEYFKQAEATVLACNCLLKINELVGRYQQDSLATLKTNLTTNICSY